MGTVVKYAGGAFGFCVVSYGTYCLLSYAGSSSEVSGAQSSVHTLDQQTKQWQSEIKDTEAKLESAAADAQKDEETIKALKVELKQKESELDRVSAKLAESSQSLSKRMETINQFRRASNDLRAKLTQNEELRKEATDKLTTATEHQKQVVSQLNPLNNPSVQALLGKR